LLHFSEYYTTPHPHFQPHRIKNTQYLAVCIAAIRAGEAHYSELTGRRGNKVLALIMSVMTTLGGTGIFTAWLAWGEKVWKLKHLWGVPSFLIAWFVMVLVMQGELLRSAEIIVKEKDFDD